MKSLLRSLWIRLLLHCWFTPVLGKFFATTAFPLVPGTSPDYDTILAQAENIKSQYQVAAGASDALTGGGGTLGSTTPITGTVFVTTAGVDAMTLPTPVAGAPSAGGNDGLTLVVVDVGGHAHTITTAANKINGNKHIATCAGNAGDAIIFRAFGGVWYCDPTGTAWALT